MALKQVPYLGQTVCHELCGEGKRAVWFPKRLFFLSLMI